MSIDREIIQEVGKLQSGFKSYPIRDLVKHAQEFGEYLNSQRLQTNQIRKFLDAVNRLKVTVTQERDFSKIEPEIVLLQPKLAYAAARQKAAKPLSDVMSKAIDRVKDIKDFDRLVQFIEAIVAYHKAAGGR
ncbi:CRISPR-associated protein Csm2 family [Geitlerinema sp. FC II]|nr:CRISPR-associated protein Csm2 family [Geitlerinema sp. FC II]